MFLSFYNQRYLTSGLTTFNKHYGVVGGNNIDQIDNDVNNNNNNNDAALRWLSLYLCDALKMRVFIFIFIQFAKFEFTRPF